MRGLETNRNFVEKIKHRVSQQQVKRTLRLFYGCFLLLMGLLAWQLMSARFDQLWITIVAALLCAQIAMAIEKWLYEGEQMDWSELWSQ